MKDLYTYLAPSHVCDGVGVFALTEIPQDTCIFSPDKIEKVMWTEWYIDIDGIHILEEEE